MWTRALWPLAGIDLDSTVFAAIRGNELQIKCTLKIPVNESSSMFTCSDPLQRQIYNSVIDATANEPKDFVRRVPLKNMRISGEYSCKYKTAKAYWFLRLRGECGKQHGTAVGWKKEGEECVEVWYLSFVGEYRISHDAFDLFQNCCCFYFRSWLQGAR